MGEGSGGAGELIRAAVVGLLASAAIAAAQATVWPRAASAYSGDDFWTLSPGGRAGLLLVFIVSIATLFAGLEAMSSRIDRLAAPVARRACVDLFARAFLFFALYAASPQLFYAYYRTIIPGLPAQIVVRTPEIGTLSQMASFGADGRLAEHAAAAVFWAAAFGAVARRGSPGATLVAACAVAAAPGALRLLLR